MTPKSGQVPATTGMPCARSVATATPNWLAERWGEMVSRTSLAPVQITTTSGLSAASARAICRGRSAAPEPIRP